MNRAEIIRRLEQNGGPTAKAAAALIRDLIDKLAQRSIKSHNHQFAEIRDMFDTLPESLRDAPYAASPDALRKHCLIKRGYCDTTATDCGSKAAAERVAASMAVLATKAHGYAIVTTRGPMVICYTPHSQSMRAMGKRAFLESKQAVLDEIALMLEGET